MLPNQQVPDIELRAWRPDQPVTTGGFVLLWSKRTPVPTHFDPALLLKP
jgi:hypothetical protein